MSHATWIQVTALFTFSTAFALSFGVKEFRPRKGNIVLHAGRTLLATSRAPSRVECAVLCANQRGNVCSFAQYYESNGECQLFHWRDVKVVQLLHNASLPSAEILIGQDPKLMYISSTAELYSYWFSDGKSLCEELGGRVGQSGDLTSAKDDGWEICACGWLQDGRGYFHVSVKTRDCGTTNFHKCTSLGPFGVHCVID